MVFLPFFLDWFIVNIPAVIHLSQKQQKALWQFAHRLTLNLECSDHAMSRNFRTNMSKCCQYVQSTTWQGNLTSPHSLQNTSRLSTGLDFGFVSVCFFCNFRVWLANFSVRSAIWTCCSFLGSRLTSSFARPPLSRVPTHGDLEFAPFCIQKKRFRTGSHVGWVSLFTVGFFVCGVGTSNRGVGFPFCGVGFPFVGLGFLYLWCGFFYLWGGVFYSWGRVF